MTSDGRRRILIDARMAVNGGGYTYLVNIVPRLLELCPDDRFRILVRTERAERCLPESPNLEVQRVADAGAAGRIRFTLLDAPRIAREWGADLFFSVSEYAPGWAPCPVIASFRNPNVFSPLEQGWPWKQRVRLSTLRGLARLSARRCDRIMFVSQDSADWIGPLAGVPEERRAVIHHGIDPGNFAPGSRPSPHPRPYILSVSSIYRYKNFVRLIEAYAELARRRPDLPDLVIIGDDQDPAYADQMRRARDASGVAERIHLLGEVYYEDVKAYYAGADLFVFPSYLETFGHPLLEAMASNTPLVAADIPVFREIAGDAAFYGDPFDPASLAGAIESALYVPGAREQLVKEGRERLAEFSWDRTALRLTSLFSSVLGEQATARAAVVRPRLA